MIGMHVRTRSYLELVRNRHGGIVAKIATKKTEVERMALAAVDQFIDSGEIEKKVREHLAEKLGPPFGDVPESLESTPEGTPSANSTP